MQKLRSYKTAISDIDLSIASGYPEQKAFKLVERKAECLEQMGKAEEASEAYKKAVTLLAKSRLAKEKKDLLGEKLRAKYKACQVMGTPPIKNLDQVDEGDLKAWQLINGDEDDKGE